MDKVELRKDLNEFNIGVKMAGLNDQLFFSIARIKVLFYDNVGNPI